MESYVWYNNQTMTTSETERIVQAEENYKKDPLYIPLTELEQSAFCQTENNLITKPLKEELQSTWINWQKIPESYQNLDANELDQRILKSKSILGKDLVVLGHHYQRDEVIKYADITGDSYLLSLEASRQNAPYVVFCGVHFMAETADILTSSDQTVILPNMAAGCSMADMAKTNDVIDAWDDIQTITTSVTPVTYMNSTASIKSLCGENNGIVCTSSNAQPVFEWAFDQNEKIFFLPDEHLGRNTGRKLGIPESEMMVWNPFKPMGGLTNDEIKSAKVLLWKGHCSVHTRFNITQINNAREKFPDVTVLVHPECTNDVVNAADLDGSTEFIIDTVNNSKPGSIFAIGTEINLVNRLANYNPDKQIFCLDSMVCPCATMYRVHPAYLSWVLDSIIEGKPTNIINVDEKTSNFAKISVNRMLEIK